MATHSRLGVRPQTHDRAHPLTLWRRRTHRVAVVQAAQLLLADIATERARLCAARAPAEIARSRLDTT